MKKGQKKTMTPKQIEANHNNSLKSTGPKTPEGKDIAKMNAMKHGILSHEVVVQGLRYKESRREFQAFREQFWQALEPVGPLEEVLVDRLAANCWRQRRVLIAETGEIALSVDTGGWERENPDTQWLWSQWLVWGDPVHNMGKSVWGIRCLIRFLEDIREDVQKHGELTEAALKGLQERFGDKPNNTMTNKLAGFRTMLSENPEGLEAEALKAKHRQCVMDYIGKELSLLGWSKCKLEEREEKQEEARQAAAVLPSAEKMDKILRYETTLDRQFHRDMNQLERLQRMRRGESVPPPLTMEVSKPC